MRPYLAMAREAEPIEDARLGALPRRLALLRSVGVFALMDVNDQVVRRQAPDLPSRWPVAEVPWALGLEDAYSAIREEALAYLDGPPLPRVAELAGLDPESEVGRKLSSSDRGQFRLVP
ncbi:hypothetical protein B7486_59045, partial [cyanobacterium TDX16]